MYRVGMICRTGAEGRGLADCSVQGLGLAPVSGRRSYLRLLRSFLPSLLPGDHGQWWQGGRGLSGGGGGRRRRLGSVLQPKSSPRSPVFGRRLEKERLIEKPEAEGQGPRWAEEGGAAPGSREGKGLKACLLAPQREKGAASLGLWIRLTTPFPFPNR